MYAAVREQLGRVRRCMRGRSRICAMCASVIACAQKRSHTCGNVRAYAHKCAYTYAAIGPHDCVRTAPCAHVRWGRGHDREHTDTYAPARACAHTRCRKHEYVHRRMPVRTPAYVDMCADLAHHIAGKAYLPNARGRMYAAVPFLTRVRIRTIRICVRTLGRVRTYIPPYAWTVAYLHVRTPPYARI